MKHLFIYTFILIAVGLGLYACDSTTAPGDVLTDSAYISNLSVSPNSAKFTRENDGDKDTTITISIQVKVGNLGDNLPPRYVITERISDSFIREGDLAFSENTQSFNTSVNIPTATTRFEEYIINVFINDESGNGSYAQSTFSVIGFPGTPPEIIEVNNPEEYQRPSSGSENVKFTAKVTDIDGQSSIKNVFLQLISQSSGEEIDDFELFDNGTSFGDEVANDSLYTLQFPVSSSNKLETYDVLYYAIDRSELVSDTVKTTFSIVE